MNGGDVRSSLQWPSWVLGFLFVDDQGRRTPGQERERDEADWGERWR